MRNDFCSNYLAHAAKGSEWGKHKYVAKVKLSGGGWLYFYSQAKYDAYLNRKNKSNEQSVGMSLKDKPSKTKSSIVPSNKNTQAVKSSLIEANRNTNKKTASEVTLSDTKDKQETGKTKLEELLAKAGKSTTGKSGGSSKSSSKKSSTGKKSSGASSKSSSSKEKTPKETKEKTAKEAKQKTAKEETKSAVKETSTSKENKKTTTMDELKSIYGKKDSDVSSFEGSASDFKDILLDKYSEGSMGYLMAGDKAYKFTIEGGDIILQDFDTDEEVPFDEYLKDIKSFKEFKTNTKKKS